MKAETNTIMCLVVYLAYVAVTDRGGNSTFKDLKNYPSSGGSNAYIVGSELLSYLSR